jgi:Peptidase family M23
MTRRPNIALVSLIAVVGGALVYLPASAQLTPATHKSLPFEKLVVPTTLAWSVLPPSIDPVMGTDGRIHLVYEMLFTNTAKLLFPETTNGTVSVNSVEVVDPARDNKVVGIDQVFTAKHEDVTAQLHPLAKPFSCLCADDYTHKLGPGESAVMYFDVTFKDFTSVPDEIAHRVSASANLVDKRPGSPTEEPPIVENSMPSLIVAIGGAVKVNTKRAITLSPPLRGDGWVDGNGCCAIVGAHRFTIIPGSGSLYAPQRFSIDYLQINAQGRAWVGTVTHLTDWRGFGAEVRSAAPGQVVSAVDGYDDNIPGEGPKVTPANIAGNHVIIDMGNGTFALYAHLKKGSVIPRRGEFVKGGQLLGLVGNSGSSGAPHLHFEIMAAPSSLEANGLPFVFDKMKYQGAVTGTWQHFLDDLYAGRPVQIDSARSGIRTGQMPLTLDVMSYM